MPSTFNSDSIAAAASNQNVFSATLITELGPGFYDVVYGSNGSASGLTESLHFGDTTLMEQSACSAGNETPQLANGRDVRFAGRLQGPGTIRCLESNPTAGALTHFRGIDIQPVM